MLRLSIEDRGDPLLLIKDLLEVLEPLPQRDFMIAGGFVRDWYLGIPFNDVDIYLFDQRRTRPKGTSKEKNQNKFFDIISTLGRFDIIKSNETFIDTYFRDKGTWYSKGKIKYRVQFILWNTSPQQVLDQYDFEHCKFFIPIMKGGDLFPLPHKYSHAPLTYSSSVQSIEENRLIPSKFMIKTLEKIASHKIYQPSELHYLETVVRRCGKFVHRKMDLPDYDISNVLETYIANLEQAELSIRPQPLSYAQFSDKSPVRSAILEDCEDYEFASTGLGSKYTIREIVENLISCWIEIQPPPDQARFLISPSELIRNVAQQKYGTL